jgi:hypothetical protein
MSSASQQEFYRYMHCNMRLRTRYGLEMDIDEYRRLNELFRTKQVINLRTSETGDLEGWVKLRDTWVCGHYKIRENHIASFMPAPPPLPEGAGGKVVDAKSAQKHRQHMAALEAQRKLKELDVAWYKARMHEAKLAILTGRVSDAVLILDGAAGQQKGSHPGSVEPLTPQADSQ